MKILTLLSSLVFMAFMINETSAGEKEVKKYTNHLKNEKSLYLKQHASNPVEWYPWGKNAFNKAKIEDKPIFLSIGYSTCHWCHEMAKKCFENKKVAKILNDTFVCIKVDREERPDIDTVYMRVCQMLTGSGGWPLNVMLTPDLKPFSAATYIPPEALINMSKKVKDLWSTNRKQLLESADQITEFLKKSNRPKLRDDAFAADLGKKAWKNLYRDYDKINGGFGKAPKFPTPQRLMFLLRYWRKKNDPKILKVVEHTLNKIRAGGIYDHLNSGFHRYSIDEKWLVPHFEKMLYDQAMLTIAYTETYLATGEKHYGTTAQSIIDYVMRDMLSPEGGFYSAEGADEAYYLFTENELKSVLTPGEFGLAKTIYNISSNGNFKPETGKNTKGNNILNMSMPLHLMTSKLNTSYKFLKAANKRITTKLLKQRLKRPAPAKDKKIIVGWNGMMIAALAKAANAFGNERYNATAKHAADFIINELKMPDGGLYHCWIEGRPTGHGMLDDYAFFIWSLLELYSSTYDQFYLSEAEKLTKYVNIHFTDDIRGGYLDTSAKAEKLLIRTQSVYDGAIPSGSSVMMMNQLRLGSLTENLEYVAMAEKNGTAIATNVNRSPENTTMVICSLMFAKSPPWQVIITGKRNTKDTENMLDLFKKSFAPFISINYYEADENGNAPDGIHKLKNSLCTVYVCRNKVCLPPLTSPDEVKKILQLEPVKSEKQ